MFHDKRMGSEKVTEHDVRTSTSLLLFVGEEPVTVKDGSRTSTVVVAVKPLAVHAVMVVLPGFWGVT